MKIEESKYEPNARMDAESSHSSERAQKEKVLNLMHKNTNFYRQIQIPLKVNLLT